MDAKLIGEAVNHSAKGWEMKANGIEMFMAAEGGQHSPVTFMAGSSKPIQPYFISHWQDAHPSIPAALVLNSLRGDFFCLPFGGNGEAVDGVQYQCHGEPATLDWELADAKEEDGTATYKFNLKTDKLPAKVEKQFQMRHGQNALYIKHTVTGLEGKMPYGHHTILKMPAENEKMYFSCGKFDFGMVSESVFSNPAGWEYQYLLPGAEFTALESIPTMFKKPDTWDYSVYPSPIGYTDLFAMFKKPGDTPAWATAAYHCADDDYMFFTLKNADELPATTLWVANSGRYEEPWNGLSRCFALEESCSFFADGWKPSIQENTLTKKGWKTCGVFKKDEPFVVREIQGVAHIPANYTKTAKADFQDGKVFFTDENGLTVEVPVDWKYLL